MTDPYENYFSDNRHYENVGGKMTDIENELPFTIPNNWSWCKIKEIFHVNPRNYIDDSLDVAFIPMPLISDGFTGVHGQEKRKWKEIKTGFTHFAEGDVGVAKITPCFENLKSVVFANLLNGYGAGTTELHVFRNILCIPELAQYALYFFKSLYFTIKAPFSGQVGQQRVPRHYFEEALFPFPPKKELLRITQQIKTSFELLSQIDTAQAELSNLAKLAKSKILDLAMRGKLVPQDPDDEPASELLARLSTSHKPHYEKLSELPYEIPQNWAVARFGDICKIFIGNSINEDYKANNYTGLTSGYSFIATKDIGFDGNINYENGIKIPFEASKVFRIAHTGTPLLCIEGGSAGRKIGILTHDTCFGNKLCAFESDIINGKLIYYFLQTPQFLSLFRENKNGLIGGVSINKLKELPFLVPPRQEQMQIVGQIKLLLEQLNLFQ